jgi:hypothetical protein
MLARPLTAPRGDTSEDLSDGAIADEEMSRGGYRRAFVAAIGCVDFLAKSTMTRNHNPPRAGNALNVSAAMTAGIVIALDISCRNENVKRITSSHG